MTKRSLTVAMRLGLGFTTLVLLLCVVATLAIFRMAALNGALSEVATDRWPKVELGQQVTDAVNLIGLELRNMMLATSKDDVRASKDRVFEARKTIVADIEKLDKMITLPHGRELLQKIREVREKYVAGQDKLIKLIEDGNDKDARAYLQTELRPVLSAYRSAVHELIKYQAELLDQSATHGAESYQTARNVMLALTAIALLLAVGIGYWITRSLTRELGGEPHTAGDVARAIGRGDLTVTVPVRAGDDSSVMASMHSTVAQLTKTIAHVKQSVDEIAVASREIAAGNQDLSQRTEEQASSLEETASSMEEMTSTVKQTADNAGQANQLAMAARQQAEKGGWFKTHPEPAARIGKLKVELARPYYKGSDKNPSLVERLTKNLVLSLKSNT